MSVIKRPAVDWNGWSLEENPYGKYFDAPARLRMIQGSRKLLPLIHKYKSHFKGTILEVGPFFNPLATKKEFHRAITYLENDKYAVAFLKNKGFDVEDMNLNGNGLQHIKGRFGVLIMSQVLNYIDYKKTIRNLKRILDRGAYIFINDVTEYGIPKLFSSRRPRTNSAILEELYRDGFRIVETKKNRVWSNQTKNERLLVVAKLD